MVSDDSDQGKLSEAGVLAPELPVKPNWMNDVSSPQLELKVTKNEPTVVNDYAKLSRNSKEKESVINSSKQGKEDE